MRWYVFYNDLIPAAINTPSYGGWSYNPSTTYAWVENGRLYAKGGSIEKAFKSLTNSSVSANVNIGTNSNIQLYRQLVNGNASNSTITATGNYNYSVSRIRFTSTTANPFSIGNVTVNSVAETFLPHVKPKIQGWEINSQTNLLKHVSTTNNTNKAVGMGTKIVKTININSAGNFEFSMRDITTSTITLGSLGLLFNDENEMEESINQDQMISPLAVFYDYNVKIYDGSSGDTGGTLLFNQDFNLTNATKIITFTPQSTNIRIEIIGKKIGDFNNPFTYAVDDLKLRKLNGYTTVYTNSFSSTVMTTNALDGWQPDSWSTTSATLDYAGGNHRLVAIGSNATATVQRDFATNANEQHSLSYNLTLLNGGSATVKVQQKIGNTYYDLSGSTQTHTASGTYNFNFTPTEADIRVVVAGTSRYALTQVFMDRNTIEEVVETYTLSAGGYRYGFNGKEKDDEVSGQANQYDYGFRIYNPRLGRFLSVDPLSKDYPWYTPYQFAGNKPIIAIDLDGLEEYIVTVRTFLPYDFVIEPLNKYKIDKANSRTYAQYHNVKAHGGYKTEQVATINFNERTSSLGADKIPLTQVKNVNSSELFEFKNTGNLATGSTTPKLEGDIAKFRLEMSSSNPAVSYGPTIDYEFDIQVSKDGVFSISGVWDGFPALEIFLEHKETGKVYLVHFDNTSDAGKNTAKEGNPDEILNLMPYLGDRKIGFSKGINYGLPEHKDKSEPTENVEKTNKLFSEEK